MLVIGSFSVRFLQSFFCLADGDLATKIVSCYWWYAANDGNYNTRRIVLIIFWIFNAVLNCLRNADITTPFFHSHNNRKLINQSHLYQENSHWNSRFLLFWSVLYGYQRFQVWAEISTLRPFFQTIFLILLTLIKISFDFIKVTIFLMEIYKGTYVIWYETIHYFKISTEQQLLRCPTVTPGFLES